jgi:hypothetical protein
MSFFIRVPVIAALIGAGILAGASPAQAQFYGGVTGFAPFNPRGFQVIPGSFFNPLPPLQPLRPLPGVNAFNPLMFNPFNRVYNPSLQSATIYYGLNRLYGGSGYSPAPSYYSPPALYPSTYSYMGTRSKESPYYSYQKAQDEVRKAYVEKSKGATGPELRTGNPKPTTPDPKALLTMALTENDPAKLMSGGAINQIFAALVDARKEGREGDSAHLTPSMLAEVRFAGGANATALNMLAAGRKWNPPPAFEEGGPLAKIGADLQRSFTAATALPKAGLPPDQVKVDALEATMRQARVALEGVINDMKFENAAAARGFLDQIDDVITVMKTPASTGLIDPRWATEGVSLADLVDHMNQYKVRFGPAADGGDAYVTLHRGLSAYLFAMGGKPEAKK